jgi:hypothetical protein
MDFHKQWVWKNAVSRVCCVISLPPSLEMHSEFISHCILIQCVRRGAYYYFNDEVSYKTNSIRWNIMISFSLTSLVMKPKKKPKCIPQKGNGTVSFKKYNVY